MTLTNSLMFVLTVMIIPGFAQDSGSNEHTGYQKPRFQKEIQRFEAADEKQAPPQGAIVCVGSSSMKGWHARIHEDLSPLTLIPRGFGGSNLNEALHYADRIILPYQPRAIVLYEGDNDIAQGISPQKISDTFSAFVEKVHQDLPQCRLYFLTIKPSIKRWHLWPKMEEANRLIAAKCEQDRRLTYVDIASGMLNEEGKPRPGIFKKDQLHMTRNGYEIWRDALRPVLLQSELEHEAASSETLRKNKVKTPDKSQEPTPPRE